MGLGSENVKNIQKLMRERGIDALFLLKPDSVLYFTGIDVECCHAIIPRDGEPTAFVLWLDAEEARKESWVKVRGWVFPPYIFLLKMAEAVDEYGFTEPTIGIEKEPILKNGITLHNFERLEAYFSRKHAKFVDASDIIHELRMIKSADEIQLLRKAASITEHGMEAGMRALKPGITELEVAAEAEYAMKKKGARRFAFKTIVASGKRTLLSHPYHSEKRIEKGDLVYIDIGAVYKGYCSDMARTFVVGEANNKQKELINIVLEAYSAGVNTIGPGVTTGEVDAAQRNVYGKHGYGKYMPEFSGHGIGLLYYELPWINKGGETKLKPNTVISVDGAIYIPPPKGIGGIRFEDGILVTETGSEILQKYPRELTVV